LLWLPFGLRGCRLALLSIVIVCLFFLLTFSVKSLETQSGWPEVKLGVLYIGIMLAAWTVSYLGVRRARRGDVPSWDAILWPWQQLVRWRPQRTPFASADGSQVWLEWRLTGKTLPIMTALV